MNFNYFFIFILSFWGWNINLAHANSTGLSEFQQSLCAGEPAQSAQIAQDVVQPFSTRFSTLSYLKKKEAKDILKVLNFKKEKDRLIGAQIMILLRERNISEITDLLNFKTSDAEVEMYRVFLKSQLDIFQGNLTNALAQTKNAYDRLDKENSFILLTILIESSSLKNYSQYLNNSLSRIEKIPDADLYKPLLLALQKLALTKDYSQYRKMVELAYQKCPAEPNIQITYISSQINHLSNQKIIDLLENFKSKFQLYPIYVDVLAARLALQTGKLNTAKDSIELAYKTPEYLSEDQKNILQAVENKALIDHSSDWNNFNKWYFIIFILISGLVCWVVYKKIKRGNI